MTDERVTSGTEWRKPREEGFVKTLPSGNVARLRPVDMGVLLASGEIPDLLTPLAVSTIMEGVDTDEIEERLNPEKLKEQTTEMIRFFNLICKASFLEPRIVDEPEGEGEIGIEDVELQDRSFVYALATQPVELMRSFRLGEGDGMESVLDGDEDGTAPVDDTESDE